MQQMKKKREISKVILKTESIGEKMLRKYATERFHCQNRDEHSSSIIYFKPYAQARDDSLWLLVLHSK